MWPVESFSLWLLFQRGFVWQFFVSFSHLSSSLIQHLLKKKKKWKRANAHTANSDCNMNSHGSCQTDFHRLLWRFKCTANCTQTKAPSPPVCLSLFVVLFSTNLMTIRLCLRVIGNMRSTTQDHRTKLFISHQKYNKASSDNTHAKPKDKQ